MALSVPLIVGAVACNSSVIFNVKRLVLQALPQSIFGLQHIYRIFVVVVVVVVDGVFAGQSKGREDLRGHA